MCVCLNKCQTGPSVWSPALYSLFFTFLPVLSLSLLSTYFLCPPFFFLLLLPLYSHSLLNVVTHRCYKLRINEAGGQQVKLTINWSVEQAIIHWFLLFCWFTQRSVIRLRNLILNLRRGGKRGRHKSKIVCEFNFRWWCLCHTQTHIFQWVQ